MWGEAAFGGKLQKVLRLAGDCACPGVSVVATYDPDRVEFCQRSARHVDIE